MKKEEINGRNKDGRIEEREREKLQDTKAESGPRSGEMRKE
jgi:hypothetical protein